MKDPGDLDVVLKDWFKNVEPTSEIWANISGGPVDDEAAAAPDEEAIKNAEVVFEASSSGKRTRQQSTVSLSGEKKRRKTKLNEYVLHCNAMYLIMIHTMIFPALAATRTLTYVTVK